MEPGARPKASRPAKHSGGGSSSSSSSGVVVVVVDGGGGGGGGVQSCRWGIDEYISVLCLVYSMGGSFLALRFQLDVL
jgi:hypothetical protein